MYAVAAVSTYNELRMAVSVAKDRFHLELYELSQDLIAKQLEVLEKKYGGSHKAKKAALIIQRAFRRYVEIACIRSQAKNLKYYIKIIYNYIN